MKRGKVLTKKLQQHSSLCVYLYSVVREYLLAAPGGKERGWPPVLAQPARLRQRAEPVDRPAEEYT